MVRVPRVEALNFNQENGIVISKKSPLSNEVICEFVEPTKEAIAKGIAELRLRVGQVEDLGIIKRAEILMNLADHLENSKEEFAQLVNKEIGKPIRLGLAETEYAASFMRSLAGAAIFHNGEVIPSANSRKLVTYERKPYGLAVLIVSFNTPLPNYAWKLAPAWLAGNGIVLKPSENTPLSARLFVEKCIESGMPQESLGLLLGGAEVGKHLVRQEFELLSFTGSLSVGLNIQEATTRIMRKTILELGGSNPIIVFSDANLENAVENVVQSAFSNSGQRCASGSRLYVEQSIYSDFLLKLRNRLSQLKVGIEKGDEVGTLVDQKALTAYYDFLDQCKNSCKIWMAKSSTANPEALIASPTIIEMKAIDPRFEEELFVPILRVASFDNPEQVLAYANSSRYGLTAAVWTKSLTLIEFFRRGLKTGVLNFNGPTHGSEFQFPFGGARNSGNGTKEVGISSLDEYSFNQIVTIDFSN
jgi:acyl-CoA reductase-like NAD-dependent aldehyde dehydrogenase